MNESEAKTHTLKPPEGRGAIPLLSLRSANGFEKGHTMTLNIPIETYKRLLAAVKILETILDSIPDIPASEITAARKIVTEIKSTYHA
jgi:hypothetical protein